MAVAMHQISPVAHLPLVLGGERKLNVAALIVGYPFNTGHSVASIAYREGLMALARPCKSSIYDNTASKKSGNSHLKNREVGVVPSEARQSKLCNTVHTL